MSEMTWGFPIEDVPETSFSQPPVGSYTMEIADAIFKTNKNGEEYLSMVYNILDAQESDWIGKKYFQYCNLDPERLKYTKGDWRRMGVPAAALTNNGGPQMMVGTVFTCDLIESTGKDGVQKFLNFRNIKPLTKVADAVAPEAAADGNTAAAAAPMEGRPAPRRAPVGRR
jgi:hypothetical protein